ncbi:MAG: HDIG domain-containing protein [Filimonas sp.]|nr:HDIG domain-containing protein [Filimonas sp.]
MIQKEKAQRTTETIMKLFFEYGVEDYDGEPVTQSSHMIQCGMLALADGSDMELVLGAFLHDIGHLLRHDNDVEAMGTLGAVDHEGIGARFLSEHGFEERICAIVAEHVAAKRYLVTADPTYKSKLSPASLQTLEWQGGAMTTDEANDFELHPFFEDIIKVRRWDELAKSTDTVLLPLSHFEKMMVDYLNT